MYQSKLPSLTLKLTNASSLIPHSPNVALWLVSSFPSCLSNCLFGGIPSFSSICCLSSRIVLNCVKLEIPTVFPFGNLMKTWILFSAAKVQNKKHYFNEKKKIKKKLTVLLHKPTYCCESNSMFVKNSCTHWVTESSWKYPIIEPCW